MEYLFALALMYLGIRLIVMAAHIIALLCSMYVLRFLKYEYNDNADTRQFGVFFIRSLLDITTGLGQYTWIFLYQTMMLLIGFVYNFFPILVFVSISIVLHMNYDTVFKYFVNSYNFLLEQNDYVSSVQRGVWLIKVSIEIVAPIWNFIVMTISGSVTEILKVLSTGDFVKVAVFGIFKNFAYFIQGMSFAFQKWVHVNNDVCSFDKLAGNENIVNACLMHANRDLDMKVALDSVQNMFISFSVLLNGVCPSFNIISLMVMYPLYDTNLMSVIQDTVNFFISLFYTTWDITSTRCRIAVRNEQSSALCFADMLPLFSYVERILRGIGKLYDNWFNWINLSVNKLILERDEQSDASCVWEGAGKSFNNSVVTFARNVTRIVSINSYLVGISDGYSVEYHSKVGRSQQKLDIVSVFEPHVHVGYGLAPVEFSGSIAQSDIYGEVNTGILGCKCTDAVGEDRVVTITCSVALFPGYTNSTNNTMRVNSEIPVRFEQSTSGSLLECKSLRISVQAVRFRKSVATFTGINSKSDPMLDCRTDPSRCNDVDALIYVMPLCSRASTEEGTEVGRTECITDSKFQTCFPYCVGMHQKRAGNTPIVLYSERSMRNGRHMVNMQCSNYNADVQNVGTQQTAYVRFSSTDYTRAAGLDVSLTSHMENDHISCVSDFQFSSYLSDQDPSDNDITSIAEKTFTKYGGHVRAPLSLLADLQPYVFAGDYVVTQKCGADTDLSSFECKWTSSLFRIQSDVYGQYKLVEVISKIPSVDTDDDKYTTPVHSALNIPRHTMDVFGNINAAVQTDSGFFYAINPDLESISERLRCSSSLSDAQGSFQVMSRQAYKKPRVFVARPETRCARDSPSIMRGGVLVTACQSDMLEEVIFTGPESPFMCLCVFIY